MTRPRVTIQVYSGHPWDGLTVNVIDHDEGRAATSLGTFLRVGERFEHCSLPRAWFPAGDLPAAGVSLAEDRGSDRQKVLGDTVGDKNRPFLL
ncbi:hypothetical protein [Leisingera daeponensis]|uniref:hypothetical protein n=1 Tax=Leisingera daeponensis TaxID=405746 RepID=UPI001C94C6EB|nr:hypothetical protein [Leisingera daeponensis]MBY6055344.1 hypothetical protein [Leisingera daeponensis]